MGELDRVFLHGDVSLSLELIKVHLNYLSKVSGETDQVLSGVVADNVASALENLAKLESLIEVMKDA